MHEEYCKITDRPGYGAVLLIFCIGDEPKSGLARDLGDCLQSRNVPFGTSGDSAQKGFPIRPRFFLFNSKNLVYT